MVALTGFKTATYAATLFGYSVPAYAAIWGLLVNIVVAVVLTFVVQRARPARRRGTTRSRRTMSEPCRLPSQRAHLILER